MRPSTATAAASKPPGTVRRHLGPLGVALLAGAAFAGVSATPAFARDLGGVSMKNACQTQGGSSHHARVMNMGDWQITNARENHTGNWVYYIASAALNLFANIHFSRHVDAPLDDHMATNDNRYYYFGYTGTFNTPNMPPAIRDALVQAWKNYFSV